VVAKMFDDKLTRSRKNNQWAHIGKKTKNVEVVFFAATAVEYIQERDWDL
jgi:hypothetical protein